MKLTSEATIQIQKPIAEVFEGIVDPAKMTQYFISESSGRLQSQVDLKWKFPEFVDWYPVTNVKVEKLKSVSFVWDPETVVDIALESLPDGSTKVTVTEGAKDCNEENLKWLVGNSGGWANFLACMKAYIEYGVQLRKGAFDFMKQNQ